MPAVVPLADPPEVALDVDEEPISNDEDSVVMPESDGAPVEEPTFEPELAADVGKASAVSSSPDESTRSPPVLEDNARPE